MASSFPLLGAVHDDDDSDSTCGGGGGSFDSLESSSPTRIACCSARRKKQCALTVLIATALLAVGAFVGAPALAKRELDNSRVSFAKLNISGPSATGYSFNVAADVLVTHVSPMDGTIGAMELELSYRGQRLGGLHMPAMSVLKGEANEMTIPAQYFEVEDDAIDLWNDFSAAMLAEEVVEWGLSGEASVTTSILGIDVRFDGIPFEKSIPLSCFAGLDDVQMSVFDMSQSTPDEIVVDMTVCLMNPSDIVIESLGDLFFGVYYEDIYMGNVTSFDSAIRVTQSDPSDDGCAVFGATGYNSVAMSGRLRPADHNVADELISRYLGGKCSNVTAKALSPVADSLPLFNAGMQGLALNTMLNGDEAPLITGMKFVSATITPIDDDSLMMDMVAAVSMSNPLGPNSPLDIQTVDMTVDLAYLTTAVGTARTGLTTVPEPNEVVGDTTLTVPASARTSLPDKGAALTAFAKDLIALDSLEVAVEGSTGTTAFCGALGYDMNIEAVPVRLPNAVSRPPLGPVTVQGMGGLTDVEIRSYSMPGNVPDGTGGCESQCGVEMEITASVFNPSPFGLVIGSLNAEVLDGDGVALGTVGTTGLTLAAGTNEVAMSGRMAPEGPDALAAAAAFMSTYLQNEAQATSVRGTDAGDSPVRWLHDVVNGIELAAAFPGAGDDFAALTDITVVSMDLELTPDGRALVAGTVSAKLNLPDEVDPSVIIDVDRSGMAFSMVDPDTGVAVGSLALDVSDVPVVYADGAITASFEKTAMTVKDADGLSTLIADLMLSASKTVRMEGTASPHAVTNMGALQLRDVPFSGDTTMYGFNNLLDPATGEPEMTITKIDISGSEGPSVLNLLVDCTVKNPSNVAPEMGAIVMELWTDDGYKIGEVEVEDFTLEANEARDAVTTFTNVPAKYIAPTGSDEAVAAGRRFLSQFVSGVDQAAKAKGAADGSGTAIDLLKPALSALSTKSVVPGLVGNLLRKSVMSIPSLFDLYDVPVVLYVTNPFSASMTITGAKCEIYPCKDYSSDTVCKTFYEDSAGYYTPDTLSATIAAGAALALPEKAVKLASLMSLETIKTLFGSGSSGALIRLAGTMDVEVGDFAMQVDFAEHDVPICLSYPGHRCEDF